jgi:hypothetical protein
VGPERARLARSEARPTPNLPALVDALQEAASRAGIDLRLSVSDSAFTVGEGQRFADR